MKCECCDEDNAWALVDEQYEWVCGDCAEDEGVALICPNTNQFRRIEECQCGRRGPVNYQDGVHKHYYCGCGPVCVP